MLTVFVLTVAVMQWWASALVVGVARLDKGALLLKGRRHALKRVGSVTFSCEGRNFCRVRQRVRLLQFVLNPCKLIMVTLFALRVVLFRSQPSFKMHLFEHPREATFLVSDSLAWHRHLDFSLRL